HPVHRMEQRLAHRVGGSMRADRHQGAEPEGQEDPADPAHPLGNVPAHAPILRQNGYDSCSCSRPAAPWLSAATSDTPPRMFPRSAGARKPPKKAPAESLPVVTSKSLSTDPAITWASSPRPIR